MHADPHSPFVARASGALTARIAVFVDADGRVLDAHVAAPSGREPEHLLLDGALVSALRRFHFQPAHGHAGRERGWSTIECALRLGPAVAMRGHAANQPRLDAQEERRDQGA